MGIQKCLLPLASLLLFGTLAAPAQTTPTAPAPTNEELNLDAYIGLLRSDVKKAKSQVISEVLQLDSTQAAKFWPIYREFEAEFSKIGDGVQSLVRDYIQNYESMAPEVAGKLADRLLSLERQRHDLKKKYQGRIKDALDPVTALRFLLVENQLEKLIDLQLAAQLPAIE